MRNKLFLCSVFMVLMSFGALLQDAFCASVRMKIVVLNPSATLTQTKMLEGFYREVQAMGGGRWDTSSLITRLERPR